MELGQKGIDVGISKEINVIVEILVAVTMNSSSGTVTLYSLTAT
jgi:hypothetical protein